MIRRSSRGRLPALGDSSPYLGLSFGAGQDRSIVPFNKLLVDPLLARPDQQSFTQTISVLDLLDLDRAKLLALLTERGGGSALRGWRRELDPDGSLDIGIQELARAAERLGLKPAPVDSFMLPIGVDRIESLSYTLEELAPAQALLVRRLQGWAKATFNGPVGLFEAFDLKSTGKMTRESFIAGCRAREFEATHGELEELYNFLDTDDQGAITREDILFLETDPVARDDEIFKNKLRSKHNFQRFLAYVYWDDGRKNAPKDRLAQRPWLASNFEKLPVLVCEKRLNHQRMQRMKRAQAHELFLQHIRCTFGNEVRGWRRGLDPECRFQVDRTSLRRYCRRLDLALDFNALWSALDRDGDGTFTIEELDTRAAHVLATTRHWARQSFGSCGAVWDLPELVECRKSKQSQGRWVSDKKMLTGVFTQALKAAGWPGLGVESIFASSLDLYGCGFISLPDLWWLDAWDPPHWLYEVPDEAAWTELRGQLLKHYGQPLRAWRFLDADNNNEVCWQEFVECCRKVKFRGNIGGAWCFLDANLSGTITMKEYDPASAELLGSFKAFAEANYGSVELAFKAFDTDGDGLLTLPELRRACRRLRWAGEVRLLFACLGVSASRDGTRRGLMLNDIIFLDSWSADPAEEQTEAASSGPVMPRRETLRAWCMDPLVDLKFLTGPTSALLEGSEDDEDEESVETAARGVHGPGFAGAGADRGRNGDNGLSTRAGNMSQPERLYRTYHVLASHQRQKVRKSRSLPWLERLQNMCSVDDYCANLRKVAGDGSVASPRGRARSKI